MVHDIPRSVPNRTWSGLRSRVPAGPKHDQVSGDGHRGCANLPARLANPHERSFVWHAVLDESGAGRCANDAGVFATCFLDSPH